MHRPIALLLAAFLATSTFLANAKDEEMLEPQILLRFETYRLPKKAAQSLLLEGFNDSELHDRLRKMTSAKTAALGNLMLARTCAGQRCRLGQTDEFPYGTDLYPEQIPQHFTWINPRSLGLPEAQPVAPFRAPDPHSQPAPETNAGLGIMSTITPTRFTTWALGDSLEIDPEVDWDNQRIGLSIAAESVQFKGFVRQNSEDQPQFETQKLNTKVSIASGVPCFLGTLSKSVQTGTLNANQDDSLSLAFITATLEVPPKPSQTLNPEAIPRYQWELISLPKEPAADLLDEISDGTALHEKLRQMIRDKAAKLEDIQSLRTSDNQQSMVEAADLLPYPTDFDPPQMPGKLTIADQRMVDLLMNEGGRAAPAPDAPLDPANGGFGIMTRTVPTKFETRNLGSALEISPSLRTNYQSLRVSLASSLTRLLSLKRYEDSPQPVLENQHLNTVVNLAFNRPLLVGTMNRPLNTGADGGNAEDRIWLAFLTAVVDPEDLAPPSTDQEPRQLLVKDEWFTLPREAFRGLLAARSSDADLCHEIKQLVRQKLATQDRLMLIRARSGQRAKVEHVDEYSYAADFDPGQICQRIAILDAASVAGAMKLPPPLLPSAIAPNPEIEKRPGHPLNGGIGLQNTVTGTTFTRRNLGDTIEVDPVIREDGISVEIFFNSENVRYAGERDYAGTPMPVFQTRKINTQFTATSGETVLAGTCSKAGGIGPDAGGDEENVTVSFITASVTKLPEPRLVENPWFPSMGHPFAKKEEKVTKAAGNPLDPFDGSEVAQTGIIHPPPDTTMRFQFELISLPTDEAAALMDEGLEDPATHERLKEMIAQDKARLEKLLSFRTVSGQRAKIEQIAETPYATDYDPPQIFQNLTIADPAMNEILRKGGAVATLAANRPPLAVQNAGFGWICGLSGTTFVVRNVGETVEIDPVISEQGGYVDLNLAAESLRLVGHTKFAEGIQPVFETQRMNTAATTRLGQPCLLGTMSRPLKTGAPGGNAADRVWLAFVTVVRD